MPASSYYLGLIWFATRTRSSPKGAEETGNFRDEAFLLRMSGMVKLMASVLVLALIFSAGYCTLLQVSGLIPRSFQLGGELIVELWTVHSVHILIVMQNLLSCTLFLRMMTWFKP